MKKSTLDWIEQSNRIIANVSYDKPLRDHLYSMGFRYDPVSKRHFKYFHKEDIPSLLEIHNKFNRSERYMNLIHGHSDFINILKCHGDLIGEGIEVPDLKKELYPTQKVALKFLRATNGLCILGDEQRVGKTYPPLVYFNEQGLKTLVLCPAHLVENWKNEIQNLFWDDQSNNFKVVSFDSHSDIEKSQSWAQAIIVDEFHLMSDLKSKRFQTALKVSKKISKIVLLSGNSLRFWPIEFYSALKMLKVDITKEKYIKRFFNYIYEDNRIKVTDLKIQQFKRYISSFYLRRRLADIAPSSVGRNVIHKIKFTPDELGDYKKKLSQRGIIFNGLDARDINKSISLLKVKYLQKFIMNILSQSNDKKIAICTQFSEVISEIKRVMPICREYPEKSQIIILDTSEFREGVNLSEYTTFIMMDVYASTSNNIQIKRRFLSPEYKGVTDCIYFDAGLFDHDLMMMPEINEYQKSLEYLSRKIYDYEALQKKAS